MSARGPVNDMWRVDIEGQSVFVRGESACHHLEQIASRLARMRMALHRIKGGHSTDPQLDALAALSHE